MSRPAAERVFGVSAALWLPLACTAFAQTPVAGGGEQATPAPTTSEIIVTAQRRAENPQDVPIAITTFTGERLGEFNIDTPAEVSRQTPGFEVTHIFGEGANPTFFMRGIGLLDFGDVTETPVALNLDDVYLGTQAAQAAPMFDVARVEVLKGPQGTLYGRNTTGGVINVISAAPTDAPEAYASAQFGSFGQQLYEAAVSGPLGSAVRGRLALYSNRDDGWQRSLTTGVDGFGQTDVWSGRAQLAFDFSEASTLLLRVDYAQSNGTSVLYPLTGLLQADLATPCTPEEAMANLCFNIIGEQGVRDPRVGLSEEPSLRNEFELALYSATYTHEFNGTNFTSITAFQHVDKLFQEDADAGAIEGGFSDYLLDADQFTQEVRLASSNSSDLQWIIGAFYFDESRDTVVSSPEIAVFEGLPFFGTLAQQETQSWAAFGQLDYRLTPTLVATAGVRYTNEEKSIAVESPDIMPVQLREIDEARTTGRLALSWTPGDDVLWYASVSTGFKAGGFNALFVFDPPAADPVAPETITAYEIGLKLGDQDDRFRFDGAVFYYDYNDVQSIALDFVDNINLTRLVTLGDAEIYGFDGEVVFSPTDAFQLNLGLGLLHSELSSSFSQLSPFPPFLTPFDGNSLPMAPEVSFKGAAQYTFSLGQAGSLTAQVDGDWRGEYSFTAKGSREATERSDGYGLLNARLRWLDGNEFLTAEAFVENLTDEEYFVLNANIFADTAAGIWGKPRTWGIRLRADF